jgi:hypothetical protein
MAIGLALLFGFVLPINFDVPYRSTSRVGMPVAFLNIGCGAEALLGVLCAVPLIAGASFLE